MININSWKNMGKIKLDVKNKHLQNYPSSTAVLSTDDPSEYFLYLTTRDEKNRSQIILCNLTVSKNYELNITYNQKILFHGERGSFDEYGTSYPTIIRVKDEIYLYYNGWSKPDGLPFENWLGLAKSKDGIQFEKYQNNPIIGKSKENPYSVGSTNIIKHQNIYYLYYTSFSSWEKNKSANSFEHQYSLKLAESTDCINWIDNKSFKFISPKESTCICRPAIIQEDNILHMWFCHRGADYQIGYNYSKDGKNWVNNESFKFPNSGEEWDKNGNSYPTIFKHKDIYMMLYAGNRYGRDGIGHAILTKN